MPALAVFIISGTLLAYEVVLMRLMAITQWSHSAYLVISTALLGFGASGTFVAVAGAWLRRHERAAVAVLAGLLAAALLVCTAAAQALDLNVLELPWMRRQVWLLAETALILMVPFFLGASAIALVLSGSGRRVTGVYAANLLGSGVGAWAAVAVLWVLPPQAVVPILAWFAVGAAVIAAVRFPARKADFLVPLLWLVSFAFVLAFGLAIPGLPPRINPFKALPGYLNFPDAEVVAEGTSPLGRLDVVKSAAIHQVPGLSYRFTGTMPKQMLLFTDADGPSAVNLWSKREDLQAFDFTTAALAYHLRRPGSVCVIGPGGGTDLDLAYYHSARRIVAVELDPRILEVLAQARNQGGRPYDPRLDPALSLVVAEGRGFLERTAERFDLIQMSMVDSFNASTAGVYALNESYLYTVEALRAYVRRLEPAGVLSMTRWMKRPERDVIKLFATAVEALEAEGLDPRPRLLLIRAWQTATLVVSREPFGRGELNRLRAFCREREFDLAYYPGIRAEEANQYHQFDRPIYYDAAQALLSDRRDEFIRGYPFEIEPATDDRPFFFHFFRPSMLPRVQATLGRNWRPFVEWGYVILLVALAAATGLGLLLILIPLAFLRRGWNGQARPARGGRAATALYCLAIGLGFMFLEMAFIQKFILFLSYPLYAVSVIIAGVLVLAGVGSFLAGRWRGSPAARVRLAAGVIVVASVIYAVALGPLLRALIGWPEWARIVMTLALLAPLAVPMGMPFPLALGRLGQSAPGLVPWAWGVNGVASVAAAPLATILAISFGFRAVVLMAAGLYVVAGAVFSLIPGTGCRFLRPR